MLILVLVVMAVLLVVLGASAERLAMRPKAKRGAR